MNCIVTIHFIGGERLNLHNIELEGENYQQLLQHYIEENELEKASFYSHNYSNVSYCINRDSIAFIEIKAEKP